MLVRLAYRSFAGSERSPVRVLHKRCVRSKRLTRALFGMDVRPFEDQPYFDLTTLLLRDVIRERIAGRPELRLLEIGVGYYAVLSGCIAREHATPLDAVDLFEDRVAWSREHVERNGVPVSVAQSNLFEGVARGPYDLIFWNLPYYEDPQGYLKGLFEQVSPHLRSGGRLLVGYNATPLPFSTVEALALGAGLRVAKRHRWAWNLHEVVALATGL